MGEFRCVFWHNPRKKEAGADLPLLKAVLPDFHTSEPARFDRTRAYLSSGQAIAAAAAAGFSFRIGLFRRSVFGARFDAACGLTTTSINAFCAST